MGSSFGVIKVRLKRSENFDISLRSVTNHAELRLFHIR